MRPGWHKGSSGGRGFQPPPTVSERGDKSRSGSWGSQERNSSSNKFAVLDDDDAGILTGGKDDKLSGNSRSEAFKSSFGRSSSTGNKPTGRSLADLAARVPESAAAGRRHSGFEGRPAGTGRFSQPRTSSDAGTAVAGGSVDPYKPDPRVIRYTREKLLSMRPVPKGDTELPPDHMMVEGGPVMSESAQDPVCWDTFDGEEIWEAFRERRGSTSVPKADAVAGARAVEATGDLRRRNAPNRGQWQRGVALPPPEEGGRRKSDHADNPNELWDDPVGGAIGAASDFSAFGAMPGDGDAFDFEKMAEASKKLEEEMHDSGAGDGDDDNQLQSLKTVDTSRPLASAGMTIRSGSGDDVNVFEDFDSPGEGAPEEEGAPVSDGNADGTASSMLMKMIGVEPPAESNASNGASGNPWGGDPAKAGSDEPKVAGIDPIFGSIGGLSLNPWGSSQEPTPQAGGNGMDLAGRLEALAAEQKAREQQIELEKRAQQEAELLRRRHEEENQRRAMAHRQAEEQARHQHAQAAAMQQQQQASQQSQVELVLMERICSILENSWGRSDLVSILTTLHSEDSRVIPLLGNVDALSALIARSPQRVALRRDPGFSGDIAVLLITNSQWQQQQQQQVHARAQQEEALRRRRMEAETRARAEKMASLKMDANLPWFYSDPQNNIQGPFRGEEMRQWLEAGYFKGDLPISQQPNGSFHPLSVWFPNLSVAFRLAPPTESAVEAPAAVPVDIRPVQSELKPSVEEKRNLAVAVEQPEAALGEKELAKEVGIEESAVPNSGNATSTQLKMMLGVSSEKPVTSAPAKNPEGKMSSNKETTMSRKSKTKMTEAKPAENFKTPEPAAEVPTPAPTTESVHPKQAAPAWGGASTAKPRKTMSEIQQEEARAAAQMTAQNNGVSQQSSSGWANVAAGSKGWSSGIVKKATGPAAATNSRGPGNAGKKVQQIQTPSQVMKKSPAGQPQVASTASNSTVAEEFGATMTPSLEKWCREQMQKINGSDDLTLVAFCMSLTDANEIRQYLTTYLGATAPVNSFATEFINKRGLGSKQEEWETPGSAKKGRKKKGGR